MNQHYKQLFCFALLLLLGSSSARAQITVGGKVTDAKDGSELPGVTVLVKGSSMGTQSDASGRYSLSNVPAQAVLVFSFVGKLAKEVPTENQTTINVTLEDDSQDLTEVVVIGYGSQKKQELTGSITSISSKDFQQGNIQSPEQLIVGKVAGVSITSNSGQPGVGSTIRIRGGASLNASNDPLIVIDGVPLSGNKIDGAPSPLSLINPNDIETFTVLKDASATAIYGSRASNGVILITTKKGKSGRPTINFNTQLAVSKIGKMVDALDANEFRTYVETNGTDAQKAILGTANTNWQEEIYRTGISTDNNLSISGALKNMPYRVSAGYLLQNGILLTDKLQRPSASVNISPRLFNKHLKIDLNLKGAITKSNYANQGAIINAVQFDPTQPVMDETSPFGGYFEWVTRDEAGVATLNPNAPRNPVSLIKLQDNQNTVQRSFGNVQFDYMFHFLPDLHANLNLGYDVSKGRGTIFVPEYAGQSFSTQGQNNRSRNSGNNKVAEFYLNYVKDIPGIKSTINATAGYGYYNNSTTNYSFANFSANGDTIAGSQPKFAFDIPENTLISYYGRLIYTLDDKYILAGSVRTDGSSRFSPENRWGVFPSVALTWRINKEKFLSTSSKLSDLKLRLSYGITGNQDGIANYSYLGIYSISSNASQYQFGNQFYNMTAPAAYDANIKWEQTATANAGLDYGFFDNRLTGSLDVYFKKTKNLLNTVPIPIGSNFSNQILTNVGNIENKGVEFAINGNPVRTKNFNWDLGFNFTYNNNKITNLTAVSDPEFAGNLTGGITGGTGQSIQIHSVNYNTFSYYVFKQVYDQAGKPLEGVYVDLNGDGEVNQKDQYRYKSPFPKVMLGFNTQLTYQKWTLSTILRANLGNYMYNNVSSNFGVERNILNPNNILGNSTTDIYKTGFFNNQYQSDYYIQNASFLRMDNIGIGYNAGRVLGNKMNLRLNATCQNVFVMTKYTGLDPEVNGGIDYNLYPRPRTFVLGLNLDF
ncbi:TonB-dependent receptor [Dyadobacter sp. CY312]|uniref:SusC/RagA family TonB-linked outer membrane protein n=1 Tax=Dyadobacter sp. CY312 TaxID=2907303 RepID=UPI001F19B269|nr:TonB-dependent receptor [Dyadobacter sp. CY312]MCE7043297.1 TonB-dependent receptor [Dyadobacter sp. CY312]